MGLAAPYRPGTVAVVALGTALMAAGLSMRLWTGAAGAFDLRDVIINARDTLPAFALPLAWLGVWAASVHTPDSAIIGPAPGRPRNQIVLRQAIVLAVATVVGWLAGWSIPGGIALATQYWTPVDLLGMAALASAVGSLASIAVAAAMLSGVRIGAFLTPVILMLVLVLPAFWINDSLLAHSSASTQALSYVWSLMIPIRGTQLVWTTEALRLGFYLLVTFTVAKAAVGLAEYRATQRRTALASTAWLALPVTVSVVVAVLAPPLSRPDPNDQVTCRDDAGYTLCLFQIDEPNRGEFEIALAPVMALLPPEVAAQTTFTQDQSGYVENPVPTRDTINRLGSGRHAWMENMNSIVRNLFQPHPSADERCSHLTDEAQLETGDLEESVILQVSRRAAAATADDPLASEQFALIAYPDRSSEIADHYLDQLTDEEFRDWYQQTRPLLEACTLAEQDFPR